MAGTNGILYTFFTALGVILIGTGLALQVLYIQNDINKGDSDYSYLPMQAASITINTLIVAYLMFSVSFFRPYSSSFQIGLWIILMMAGLAFEIYLTNFNETPIQQGLSYTFAGINAALRLYLLISVRCDRPLSTIEGIINAVPQVAKAVGKSSQEIVRDIGAQASDVDPMRTYQNVMSNLGSIISDLPDDKKNAAKDAVRKGVGAPPRQQGGRKTR
jgi:hypothetical protein